MKHRHSATQHWRGQSGEIWRLAGICAIAYACAWMRHYLPAELVALVVAVLGVTLAAMLTSNELILVVASVYSGNASYYGVLIVSTYIADRRAHPLIDGHSAAYRRHYGGFTHHIRSLYVVPL